MSADEFAGRRILVTGGSHGIGLTICRELAARGAAVSIIAREERSIADAIASLEGKGHTAHPFDVSRPEAWEAAFADAGAGDGLHGLVAAAGVLGPVGPLDLLDPAGVWQAVEINLRGTLLAVYHSLPYLRASGGHAVLFSGGGATAPLPRYDAYAISKAAIVRLAENVAALGEITINCVAPGFVATRIHRGTLEAGAEAAGAEYYESTRRQLDRGGMPPREAAELTCLLLSEEARGINGKLISAQWDPWRDPGFRDALRGRPELATLRRIDDHWYRPAGN